MRTHKGTRAYELRNIAYTLCTNNYHNYQASHAMKFHHVPPFVQELPSGSNGPARWSESMEKMYGPPPRVPQGFSQLDADTESKKNAIGLVMASGLDYKRAVELLEYCEGDVELALNKLEKAQIRESTNDVRKPPQPHAVRAAG